MDIATITSLISTIGFPIVAVLGCAIFIYKIVTAQREDYNNRIKAIEENATQREDKLYEQLEGFNDSLQKFNETLIKIDSRLANLEKSVEKVEDLEQKKA